MFSDSKNVRNDCLSAALESNVRNARWTGRFVRRDVSKDFSDIILSNVGERYGRGVRVTWDVGEVGGRGVGEECRRKNSTFVGSAMRHSLGGLEWGE